MPNVSAAQCMWKSTTHIGMASATDSRAGVYVVGRYSPRATGMSDASSYFSCRAELLTVKLL